MNLQAKLDARKKEFKASAPEDVQEIMRRATKELEQSGIVERAKGEGEKAPDFSLVNQHGESIRLKDRLAQGPVVLGFYRGRW